ncbi:MAG: amidohydrolase [Caldilinea sp. CFX5]|nr:amidohydrolase [Caldilinea sp. CFX5]
MIIDTHTHFYDPHRPQGVPWPTPDNPLLYRTVLPEQWKALALPAGVTGTVVVEASNWLEDNQWVLDLAAQDGSLVGLVGHIDPNRPAFAAELARFAANPRFRGIRCGGRYFAAITQGSFLADMALLAAKDLSLDVLLSHEQFDGLIALAERLPTLRIVIDHIGHMPIDGQAISAEWVTRYQRLAAQPNLYMKVSALMEQSISQPAPTDLEYYRPTLDVLWQAFGEDRLIYGSNWPVCERAGDFYGEGINIVKQYFQEKGEAVYQKYFWQNAQVAYQLP